MHRNVQVAVRSPTTKSPSSWWLSTIAILSLASAVSPAVHDSQPINLQHFAECSFVSSPLILSHGLGIQQTPPLITPFIHGPAFHNSEGGLKLASILGMARCRGMHAGTTMSLPRQVGHGDVVGGALTLVAALLVAASPALPAGAQSTQGLSTPVQNSVAKAGEAEGESEKRKENKSTLELNSPIAPSTSGRCPPDFVLRVEGGSAAAPPRPVCRPTSSAVATSEMRRMSNQVRARVSQSVKEKMKRVKEAEKLAAERNTQMFIDLRAEKKQATKDTTDKKERDAEGQNFPLSVQQDIVKKEKAKARQGLEEAIEEAKRGYSGAQERANKRGQNLVFENIDKSSREITKELAKQTRELQQRQTEMREKKEQRAANEKMLKAQEEEIIKQMEAGLEAPVTSTTPTIKIEKQKLDVRK